MSGSSPTLDGVVRACVDLIDAGAALHWLVPRQKRPILTNWSEAAVLGLDELKGSYRKDANIGIRLGSPSKTEAGYIHLIDLDIRDSAKAAEAHAALAAMLPNYLSLPTVISGSGGESRHFYFVTDKPFSKRKLAKSAGFSMVFDPKLDREVKKNDWEIDLLGTGSQAVLPPSVHPDTGLPYKWLVPFEADLIAIGVAPTVPSDLVAEWGARTVEPDPEDAEDDDDLLGELRQQAVELEEGELDGIIADLPEGWVEDRDSWVTVGAALHHQFGGAQKGFDIWCDWSKGSEKYDPKTQKSVWKSFKGDHRPVTLRTLIAAAREVRLQRNLPALVVDGEVDDDLESILGPPTNPPETPAIPVEEIDPDWTSYLARNDEGHPTACLHNARLVVQNDVRLHGTFALNEFTSEIVLINEPKIVNKKRDSGKPVLNLTSPIWRVTDPVNGHLWTDSHDHDVRLMIEAPRTQGGYGFKVSDRDLKAAVDIGANNRRFHPVRNYLAEAHKHYDGIERVERMFVDWLGAEDTPYHREAARLFFIGAVARVMEPGHKFDFVPILEGLQGKRKSTFIRVLGRQSWFAELTGDIHDRRAMVEQLQGAWIIEIPEMQAFSRADTNYLKAFVSAVFDKARPAYARRVQIFYRQCVFMATTNDSAYLRDTTGGRRFWPIKCNFDEGKDIDTDALEGVIDHVWGEAMQMYLDMRRTCKKRELPLYLSNAASVEAKELQESRRVHNEEDVFIGTLEGWLDTPIGAADGADDFDTDAPQEVRNVTCIEEIWTEMMGRDPGSMGRAEATKIGNALNRLEGWVYAGRMRTKKYGQQRVYRRTGLAAVPYLDL